MNTIKPLRAGESGTAHAHIHKNSWGVAVSACVGAVSRVANQAVHLAIGKNLPIKEREACLYAGGVMGSLAVLLVVASVNEFVEDSLVDKIWYGLIFYAAAIWFRSVTFGPALSEKQKVMMVLGFLAVVLPISCFRSLAYSGDLFGLRSRID